MSVQQLSDALEQNGVSMARPVLSNLENGRREVVSVAELLALGTALRVPPLLLLFPLGRTASVEPVPNAATDAWNAFQWASGDPNTVGLPVVTDDETRGLVALFLSHDNGVSAVSRNLAGEADARQELEAANAEGIEFTEEIEDKISKHERWVHGHAWTLQQTRRKIRERGLEPPDLSSRMSFVDEVGPL